MDKESLAKPLDKFKMYFLCFLIYSFMGWIYEVFLEVVIYKWGYSDRGVLFGPYCIIYGVGSLIFIFTLKRLKSKKIKIFKINITPILVFLGIIFITTFLELIGSYVMELIKGSWMWDYSDYPYNFQGRIALNPSIRFGLGGMVILYVFQPLFERLIGRLTKKKLDIISGILFLLFLIDVLFYIFKSVF